MPRNLLSLGLVGLLLLTPAIGAEPPATSGGEGKLRVRLYGPGPDPIATSDLLLIGEVAYQFVRETPEEVILIDLSRPAVTLVDLRRQRLARVSLTQIDAALDRRRDDALREVHRLEATGARADRVKAEMARDLIEPHFAATFDAPSRRLTLTNGSVRVEARGEHDTDAARLDRLTRALNTLTKLGAWRDPGLLPASTRVETVHTLGVTHGLRPTEVTYLYHLMGPPQKLRWTYELAEGLTPRDREAVARVRGFLGQCTIVSREEYDRR